MNQALASALVALLSACDNGPVTPDAGHTGPGASCTEIIEHCHDVDTGVGEAAACHEIGHDGPVEMCDARLEACIAICDAAGADGGSGDAGAHDEHDGSAH